MLPLYISERNFSENILLLTLSFFTLRVAADTLRLRLKEPPSADAPDIQEYVDELLPAFCERYHLTARERVILEEVLQGKDNQNIASSLQLALGTVKAHVPQHPERKPAPLPAKSSPSCSGRDRG